MYERYAMTNTELKYLADYPKIPIVLTMLFCGYVIAWYLQIGFRIPFLGDIRFEYYLTIILAICAVLFTPKKGLDCPLYFFVGLYFLSLIYSLIMSHDPDRSMDIFVNRIVKFSFMSWFIILFVRSPKHMAIFIAAYLFACLKMGQEGYIGKISGNMIWENQGVMRLNGSTPLYSHPNSYAGMAIGTLPFIWALWPIAKKYQKYILFVLAAFSVNIIVYTGSRTGYIAFIFFLFLLFAAKINIKKIVVSTVLGMLFLTYIPDQYIGRFETIYTLQEKEGRSSEKRIQIMKDALAVFAKHPFGVGIQAFPAVREQYFDMKQDTHNLYLEVATNLGVQGVVVFALLIAKMLKILNNLKTESGTLLQKNMDVVRSHTDDVIADSAAQENISDIKLVAAIANATILFVLLRLCLGLFGMDLYEIYWWFALGITISLYNMHKIISDRTNKLCEIYAK